MALPKSYLTSVRNLSAILNAIKTAQAPPKFSQKFLESLGFKATADRLIIGVLKSLGFLQDDGKSTGRYYEFLDQTQSGRVLAEGIREAFSDLFHINIHANKLSKAEVINKFKTLSQGQLSDSVLDKMSTTFTSLVKLADFEAKTPAKGQNQKLNNLKLKKSRLKQHMKLPGKLSLVVLFTIFKWYCQNHVTLLYMTLSSEASKSTCYEYKY